MVLELICIDGIECVNVVKMSWLSKSIDLPLNEMVWILVDISKVGIFIYSCWMNMVFGRVIIEKS